MVIIALFKFWVLFQGHDGSYKFGHFLAILDAIMAAIMALKYVLEKWKPLPK